MPSLLVIDDEPAILHAFRRAFDRADVTLLTAASGAEGLEEFSRSDPDVVVLDVNLPDFPGLEVFRRIREKDARVPVIFITGHGTTETAIEAMKLGAFDYLLKPLELASLEELVGRALEISRLTRIPARTEDEPVEAGADVLVGRSPAMQEVYKTIGRVAPQDVTVLILGETGTGKELVARAIYQHSRRSAGPVSRGELRRDSRDVAGERTLRPREGGLHRAPIAGGSVSSNNATGERCSSTRSAI